jgi:hypothetical protein
MMATSNYLESYFSEITALRAFEGDALDYLMMNYSAIGPVLAWEPNLSAVRTAKVRVLTLR